MTIALATRRPRRALHLFRHSLAHPAPDATPSTTEGLVWLFFHYRQPQLALEALSLLHHSGRRIPVQLATKVLRGTYDSLVLDQDRMNVVFGWLKSGITGREEGGGETMDEGLVETVLELLARMGRTDVLVDLFEAYLAALPTPSIGPDRIWSLTIRSLGESGDLAAASALFARWRSLHLSTSTPPPEGPYLTFLRLLASHSSHLPPHKSPAYAFLPTLAEDDLPPTVGVHNALLHLELARRAYPSFWTIWAQLSPPPPSTSPPSPSTTTSPSANAASYALAVRALLLQSLSPWHHRRRTHRHGPSPRSLLSSLLLSSSLLSSSRPQFALPTPLGPPFLSPKLLNSLLHLFITTRDYPSAVLILESFRVHAIEPTEKTHEIVVLGIVRAWEKGKLAKGALEEEERMEGWEVVKSGWKERTRERRTPEKGLRLVGRILEKRRMRVGLWVREPLREGMGVGVEEQEFEGTVELVPHERPAVGSPFDTDLDLDGTTIEEPPLLPPPAWMLRRELRNLGYLVDLLRRAEGVGEEEWQARLSEVRSEVLPVGKGRRTRDERRTWDEQRRFDEWLTRKGEL